MSNRENYEKGDFYIWLMQQAQALKSKDLDNIEYENLAEEIEALAREQVRECGEYVHKILLVKVRQDHFSVTPNEIYRCREEISIHRSFLKDLLKLCPSIREKIDIQKEWQYVLSYFKVYPNLKSAINLSDRCPYTLDELLGE